MFAKFAVFLNRHGMTKTKNLHLGILQTFQTLGVLWELRHCVREYLDEVLKFCSLRSLLLRSISNQTECQTIDKPYGDPCKSVKLWQMMWFIIMGFTEAHDRCGTSSRTNSRVRLLEVCKLATRKPAEYNYFIHGKASPGTHCVKQYDD